MMAESRDKSGKRKDAVTSPCNLALGVCLQLVSMWATRLPLDCRCSCAGPRAADTYELWWPVGYGGQPLYPFAIAYTPAGNSTSNSTLVRNVGFRTMELVREARTETFTLDVQLESFFFRVNGVPIFARGALA